MIRKISTFALIIFSIGLISSIFASNGTQIGTVGARSTSMGSNFRGLADDWSAVFFNPAGLTQLSGKWTIGGSVGLIMPRGSYTPLPFSQAPFSGLYTNKRTLVEQNFYVPSLGIFYKFSEKFTAGLGVCAPFGLGAQFNLLTIPADYGNDTALAEINETMSDHQVVNIQPTLAFKLSDQLSIGASVGYIAFGMMKLRQIGLPEYGKINPAVGNLFLVLRGTQVLLDDHERLVVENYMDGEGHAWSASFGIHFKPSESFSFGVSARYYTDLKLTGTMNRKIHFPGNAPATYAQGISGYFAQVPGPQTVDSLTALGSLPIVFSGVTTDTSYNADANLPLPLTLGAGIAFKPTPKLTLVADISWTRWSTWDAISIKMTNKVTGQKETLTMKEDWIDTFEFGAGAEYCVLSNNNMKLDLRGGFYMVDTPSPHETISPTILDPKNRTVITAGLGLNLGKLQFSLAYERVILGEEKVDKYIFDSNNGTNENWAGKYIMNANVITLGTTVIL